MHFVTSILIDWERARLEVFSKSNYSQSISIHLILWVFIFAKHSAGDYLNDIVCVLFAEILWQIKSVWNVSRADYFGG